MKVLYHLIRYRRYFVRVFFIAYHVIYIKLHHAEYGLVLSNIKLVFQNLSTKEKCMLHSNIKSSTSGLPYHVTINMTIKRNKKQITKIKIYSYKNITSRLLKNWMKGGWKYHENCILVFRWYVWEPVSIFENTWTL